MTRNNAAILLMVIFGGVSILIPASVLALLSPPCGSFGDIDGDGFVTDADADLVGKIAAGFSGFSVAQIANADVDGDGTVTVFDNNAVLQYVEGIISTFPVCPPAAAGTECNAKSDCVDADTGKTYSCQGDDPSTSIKEGRCKGPCTANDQCGAGTVFVDDLLWANGTCTGDIDKPGSCIEAVALGTELPPGPQTGSGLLLTIESITDWLFVLFLLAATIFIILAAFQFLTGGGDSAKIAEARQKLLYAVIAVIVAAFAKGVPVVIRAIVGV